MKPSLLYRNSPPTGVNVVIFVYLCNNVFLTVRDGLLSYSLKGSVFFFLIVGDCCENSSPEGV